MRRNDVASTSFRRHVPTRFLFNQCQTITFLVLKSDIIENSRIELRGIVLPAPSNQIKKLHLLLFYPSTWYICDFFLFHIEIEGKGGWNIWGGGGGGGGGGQMICCPLPLPKLFGGASPPPPPLWPPLFLRLCSMELMKILCLGCVVKRKSGCSAICTEHYFA